MIAIGVALILFEGRLRLDFLELREAGDGVWRLVIFGEPIGWLLGSLATHYVAGLAWPVAILFAHRPHRDRAAPAPDEGPGRQSLFSG